MCFLIDFDMKKDIDTLIAEERAEIISKYDKVGVYRKTCDCEHFHSDQFVVTLRIFLQSIMHL